MESCMSRTYPMTSQQVDYIKKKTEEKSLDEPVKRPEWLKVKIPHGEKYFEIKNLVTGQKLHTVCEEARCPNISECWHRGTATFMILGDVCTRSCGFCAVKTGKPTWFDPGEPDRVAQSVETMGLRHVVITSVNRDELPDGGASIFAATIRAIRHRRPSCRVEVLIPDFKGNAEALKTVMDARPDILNHNTETVPRLYRVVRPQANYAQSLELLTRAKQYGMTTKSGLMVGLGEAENEVLAVMQDLVQTGLDVLTIGQYLQPTKEHIPVDRFVHPDEFARYKAEGEKMGFRVVESGPLVRSSYHADEQTDSVERYFTKQRELNNQ
jgi:lipoic acid synthetase